MEKQVRLSDYERLKLHEEKICVRCFIKAGNKVKLTEIRRQFQNTALKEMLQKGLIAFWECPECENQRIY